MAKAPSSSHETDRRRFQWKRYGAGFLAILAVAVPMYGLYKTNQSQIDEAKTLSQQQHTSAQVDRAVTHQRLDVDDAHFKWEDQQIEDLWKECHKP